MDKKNKKNLLWLLILALATIGILARHNRPQPFHTNQGMIFGTMYNIIYQHEEELRFDIERELQRFDGSLSPFNDTSIISRVNRNEAVTVDTLFKNVFQRSMQVSQATNGAFDITIAPLVNVWGFGFKQERFPTQVQVDSLLKITGYNMIQLDADGTIKKDDPRIMLTCSAIAKGYAVDIIAELLSKKGVKNFMVDIGGEVVVKGKNPRNSIWRIGINKPVDDSLAKNNTLQTILHIQDVGLATSGNYRNFYYRDGKKYAHTIDPRTGYPVDHSLLSATVIAPDCMTADAYATAFMVMGIEEATQFTNSHPEIDAYFIYADEDGALKTHFTKGMSKYIKE